MDTGQFRILAFILWYLHLDKLNGIELNTLATGDTNELTFKKKKNRVVLEEKSGDHQNQWNQGTINICTKFHGYPSNS